MSTRFPRGRTGGVAQGQGGDASGFSSWKSLLVTGYTRMRASGQLLASADPDRMAVATLAALQGGLLLAQVERNVGPIEAAMDMALAGVANLAA